MDVHKFKSSDYFYYSVYRAKSVWLGKCEKDSEMQYLFSVFGFVWLLIDTLVDISSSWKRSDYHCLSVKRETVTLAPWFADLNTVPGHREGTVDSRLMQSFTLRWLDWLDTILHVALIHETFETLALAFYAVVELIVAPAMNNEYALCWELWRAGGLLIYSPSTFESLGSVLLSFATTQQRTVTVGAVPLGDKRQLRDPNVGVLLW